MAAPAVTNRPNSSANLPAPTFVGRQTANNGTVTAHGFNWDVTHPQKTATKSSVTLSGIGSGDVGAPYTQGIDVSFATVLTGNDQFESYLGGACSGHAWYGHRFWATNASGTTYTTTSTNDYAFQTGYNAPVCRRDSYAAYGYTKVGCYATPTSDGDYENGALSGAFYYSTGANHDPTNPSGSPARVGFGSQAVTLNVQFSYAALGLTAGQTYYFTGAVVNTGLIGAYSAVSTITMPSYAAPTVSATTVSNIKATTVDLAATISDANGYGYDDLLTTAEGFVLATHTAPTTSDIIVVVDNNQIAHAISITVGSNPLASLRPNTLYYVRAFATSSGGTTYGAETSFTTHTDVKAENGVLAQNIKTRQGLYYGYTKTRQGVA